jgi:acetyl esterase/lipase
VSRRLGALNLALARVARPKLARTAGPEAGAVEFARIAGRLFRVPPGLCMIPDRRAARPLWRVTCGPAVAGRTVLFLHGGAYFAGAAATHRGMMGRLARLARVEVVAPDYRLLQEAPFPAAFEDALAAWDHLRRGHEARAIVIAGDSAGGGLALALLAHLLARGEQPAGLVVFSPWTDLTLSGASLMTGREVVLPVERMAEVAAEYLAGADPRDPRASPLFGGFDGAPPVLIQVGSEEALLSDSERIAERLRGAGAEVHLRVWARCPHVWQLFDGWLPEARAALREAAAFVQTSFERARR